MPAKYTPSAFDSVMDTILVIGILILILNLFLGLSMIILKLLVHFAYGCIHGRPDLTLPSYQQNVLAQQPSSSSSSPRILSTALKRFFAPLSLQWYKETSALRERRFRGTAGLSAPSISTEVQV